MDLAQPIALSKHEINTTAVRNMTCKCLAAGKPIEETLAKKSKSRGKRQEGKAKKTFTENAKILENLPEPPEFDAYKSPFMVHSASPILPPRITSNPEPLALFNLFFGNDILAQIVNNTNRYAEIKQQTVNSNQYSSVNTSAFIPVSTQPLTRIPSNLLHPDPAYPITC
ncbi:hypothetical protein L873DRAFT_1792429 [Choiromyces venosus 120613-1]|uniref:PiggyBac transposable element-derived protein domain-containing protein n=1 Tax=Choiromyces venosus 120613-1 TaxID=1336337 RepID=A0A3N4JAE5_9PEZI|nr:hypothetical protein L873DRAFT_1792429 [Choiromyces venosus 120613-1]